MNEMKMVWDWKVNCNKPFLHVFKRTKTEVEEITDNCWEMVGLIYAAMPIIIMIRIYVSIKKIFNL